MSERTVTGLVILFVAAILSVAVVMWRIEHPSCDRDHDGMTRRVSAAKYVETCHCRGLGPSSNWKCTWEEGR